MVEGKSALDRYQVGENVTIRCNEGFTLFGYNHTTCRFLWQWAPYLGTCVPNEQGGCLHKYI